MTLGSLVGAAGLGALTGAGIVLALTRAPQKEPTTALAPSKPTPEIKVPPSKAPNAHVKQGQVGSRFGVPTPVQSVKHYGSTFALGYDRRLRTSAWAYEVITMDSISGDAKRRPGFYEDPTELHLFRARPTDLSKTGLDRGHLVPAADYKGDQIAMNETFVMSNICAQDMELNRGFWGKILEPFMRGLAHKYEEVHVISGPLYLPRFDSERMEWQTNYRVVGHELSKRKSSPPGEPVVTESDLPVIPVPTHLYKVVMVQDEHKQPLVAAFVIPNAPVEADTSLASFQSPVWALEALSGHLFFPKVFHPEVDNSTGDLIQPHFKPIVPKDLCKAVSCEGPQETWRKATKSVASQA